MDYVIFVVLMIIAVFYFIHCYFGTAGVVLVIAALIIGFVYLIKSSDKQDQEKRMNSSYVQNAMKFIRFYRMLGKGFPLISTPHYLGVNLLYNDYLGVRIKTYLDGAASAEVHQIHKRYLDDAIRSLLGANAAEGMELYRTLGLDVKLHDNDMDFPVIFMWLYSSDRYNDNKFLKKWYEKTYGEELTIAPYDDY